MYWKSMLARPFAGIVQKQVKKFSLTAIEDQGKILKDLLLQARNTEFGKQHRFDAIAGQAAYAEAVPIRDYEQIKPWIEKIKAGKHNILWKGKPLYFAKTSGTTSGIKYIPITNDSIPNHILSARNALLCYMAETGNYTFANGKMIFLSGSPELERMAGIPTGRLSGIVNHHIPRYLRTNQLPSYETNCMDDWESKLDKIVEETIRENMTLISGIPPWMQMYFDRLMNLSGKRVGELFPNLSVLVHGGVNFEPYKPKLIDSIGRNIDTIETFPASEGFFAFQDSQSAEGLLLNTNSGIYFEFVKASEVFEDKPRRYSLAEVSIGENYAIIISSNAGLWAYNLGDTVRFLSTNPYRLVVSGRIKHFISAFGEHVIGEEVDFALTKAAAEIGIKIAEFTVAPFISNDQNKSYHEWFIEFEDVPANLNIFAESINTLLQQKNVYYQDLQQGNILSTLQIRVVRKGGFIDYMKSIGKLGGQNKVPRLSNDRQLADALQPYLIVSK